MPMENVSPHHQKLHDLKKNLTHVIRGKDGPIDMLLTAFCRIQFTPDLLPGDILGSSIYNPMQGTFTFRQGPVFANFLLADKINRASPRTQSALLEAMSEGQATIEGTRYPIEPPFMLLATQNPVEFHGTYPLPEAQLDRFLMLLSLGYPEPDVEVEILHSQAATHPLEAIGAVLSRQDVTDMQSDVRAQA